MPRKKKDEQKINVKYKMAVKKKGTSLKKIDDIYTPMVTTGYHIDHKEGIEQFTVYLWMFRVPIFIYVGDLGKDKTENFFKKEREKYGLTGDFAYDCNGRTLSEPGFGHLIWLRNFSITTLVHELCHVTQTRMRYCGMSMDDEAQAYFLQGLIDQVLSMDKKKKFAFYEPLPLDD